MQTNRTHVQLQPETFTAVYAGETIHLLPKEYALLEFLYRNRNRPFSRQELLDRVWGLEEPTDRTVDDHIYRLRKKLQSWSHLCRIETIRGYGYKLTVKEPAPTNPQLSDREFAQHVQHLFRTYHGLGMGAAMLTLSANQDVLGFELDTHYSVYLHFVSGDFAWFVNTDSLSFWEKLFYLLHIYGFVQDDVSKVLSYFERALQQKQHLPGHWAAELEMNILALYLQTEQLEVVKERLQAAEKIAAAMNSNSFTLVLLFHKLHLALLAENGETTESLLLQAEELLAQAPMQRELGSLTMIKGLWLYQQGNIREARQLADEAVDILKQTKFVPHLLFGIHNLLFFLKKWDCDDLWERKYRKIWQELAEQYRFAELERKIDRLLQSHL
jgi:DNA-binding winged helix-turn-helix (wHTH) protein